jgi:hypothetical protein
MLRIFSTKHMNRRQTENLSACIISWTPEGISIECGGQNNVLRNCPVKPQQPLLDMKHKSNFIDFLKKILSFQNAQDLIEIYILLHYTFFNMPRLLVCLSFSKRYIYAYLNTALYILYKLYWKDNERHSDTKHIHTPIEHPSNL